MIISLLKALPPPGSADACMKPGDYLLGFFISLLNAIKRSSSKRKKKHFISFDPCIQKSMNKIVVVWIVLAPIDSCV